MAHLRVGSGRYVLSGSVSVCTGLLSCAPPQMLCSWPQSSEAAFLTGLSTGMGLLWTNSLQRTSVSEATGAGCTQPGHQACRISVVPMCPPSFSSCLDGKSKERHTGNCQVLWEREVPQVHPKASGANTTTEISQLLPASLSP